MTVARGNPAGHEVLVDSWPHFGIVLTRLRPEVLLGGVPPTLTAPHTPRRWGWGGHQAQTLSSIPQENRDPEDFYANQLTVYYRDEGAWRALLGGTQAVDWTQAFQMQGKGDTGKVWGDTLGYPLARRAPVRAEGAVPQGCRTGCTRRCARRPMPRGCGWRRTGTRRC